MKEDDQPKSFDFNAPSGVIRKKSVYGLVAYKIWTEKTGKMQYRILLNGKNIFGKDVKERHSISSANGKASIMETFDSRLLKGRGNVLLFEVLKGPHTLCFSDIVVWITRG